METIIQEEIFTAGTWNGMSFTEGDLDVIAQKYNDEKAKHLAPVVIGHPKDNAPAYGWVERVFRQGNKLFADIKIASKDFADWLKAGYYKKKSIALGENFRLVHVGYLGAAAPAVEGLQDYQFSGKDTVRIYKFMVNSPEQVSTIEDAMQLINDYLSDVLDSQMEINTVKLLTNQIISGFNKNKESAMANQDPNAQPETAEFADIKAQFTQIKAEYDTLKTEAEQLKAKLLAFTAREEALKQAEFEAFFAKGEFLPVAKEQVKAVYFNSEMTENTKTEMYKFMKVGTVSVSQSDITNTRSILDLNKQILSDAGIKTV